MIARKTLVPVLLALLAFATGCGADDEGDVRETAEAWAEATAQKDYQRMCDDLLSPDLVESVRATGQPCEIALKTGLEDVKDPRIVVRSVKVDGDKAEARIRSTAQGQEPSEDIMRLVKIDGSWRIGSLAS